ncbi:hypothetical protein OK016_01040 [Vibrio chagasii]|nr:hypothetical protein [Vibrio chagasii]
MKVLLPPLRDSPNLCIRGSDSPSYAFEVDIYNYKGGVIKHGKRCWRQRT